MTGRAAFRRKSWTASFFFFLLCKFVYKRLSSWFLSILNIHHSPKESNLRQKNNKCRATAICWSSAKFVCGREWGAAPANMAAEGPAQERERQASARSLARRSHSRGRKRNLMSSSSSSSMSSCSSSSSSPESSEERSRRRLKNG